MRSVEAISILRILGLALYFLIAAQGAFYHFGFGKALFHIPAESFIELRKAVDLVVRSRFKVLYLSTLVTLVLWMLLAFKTEDFLSYAPVLLAFLFLVADMVLIIKFSEPVNELINSDLLNTEAAFIKVRKEWIRFIMIRGHISLSGFAMLLLHLLIRKC